jgi:dethiobiotin synthetase
MDHSSLYITGTDTGAGKTAVAAALLRGLGAAGLRAAGMKPLASGCRWQQQRWENEDALTLLAAGMPGLDYATVNPIALPEATAPEIAARRAGLQISLDPLRVAHAELCERADIVLVEGVGGWLAPLSATLMQADLSAALNLPVVLVVGLRLGCINHALLSLQAIRADRRPLLGWIGCAVDPALGFAAEYREILRQRLQVPCLGMLEHGCTQLAPEPLLQALGRKPAPRT